MSKSLVAMANDVAQVEQALINSEGAITPEIEALLSCKDLELPEKVDGYAYRHSRFAVMEAWYKEKAEEFLKIAKSYAKAQATLKENAKTAMELLGTDELKGNDWRLKVSKAKPSVKIENLDQIGGEYLISEMVTRVDKNKIAAALSDGHKVPGAELESNISLRVYANISK